MNQGRGSTLPLVALLGLVWGSGYVVARFATIHGVPPLAYSFWQALGPAILLAIVSVLLRQRFPCSLPHIAFYAATGLLGIAIPNTIMYYTAAHVPSGLLALIVNTVPIFTYALAWLVGAERFLWHRFLGVLLGLLGILLTIMPSVVFATTFHPGWGGLLLLTPIAFAQIGRAHV